MPRRKLSARVIKLVCEGGGEPPTCFCGGGVYTYSFERFPMTHVSRCKACGFEHRCDLQTAPPRKPPKPPEGPIGYQGFPPFWY